MVNFDPLQADQDRFVIEILVQELQNARDKLVQALSHHNKSAQSASAQPRAHAYNPQGLLPSTNVLPLSPTQHNQTPSAVPLPLLQETESLMQLNNAQAVENASRSFVSQPEGVYDNLESRGYLETTQGELNEPLLSNDSLNTANARRTGPGGELTLYRARQAVKQSTPYWGWFTALCFLVMYLANHVSDHTTTEKEDDKKVSNDRYVQALQCAQHYTDHETVYTAKSTAYGAVVWFLHTGLYISLHDCHLASSEFGMYYSLLMLRNTMRVTDVSWYPEHTGAMLESGDVCKWTRVQCDQDKKVQGLIFNNASLTGSLPTELGGLAPSLRTLQLFSNPQLHGSLPTQLGLLTMLVDLEVHQTSVSGSVPTELGRLSHLDSLLVDHTHLSGSVPSQVCGLHVANLRADCVGDSPQLECACCSNCKHV
jgi:hypothetical protein